MRLFRLIVSALACCGASGPLRAQAPADDPLYHIEIIVFSWLSADRGEEDFRHGREDLPPAPAPRLFDFPALEIETLPAVGAGLPGFGVGNPAPPPAGPVTEASPGPGAAPDAAMTPPRTDGLELIELAPDRSAAALRALADAAPLPGGFRILRPDELTLAAEAAQLARRAPYRVLGHVGWEQAGVDENRTAPVDLRYLGITNPGGTITFWISRIRHAIVDLVYVDGTGSFWSAPAEPGLVPLDYGETYRLREESNDYLREIWYVDHPLFGVLILVRPAPAPADADGSNTGGPAA